jgi:hypothetical protein
MLKNLKELIGIVLFFGAGVVWVGGYFATKSHLEEIRCLLQAQLDFARAEYVSKDLKDETVKVSVQIDGLKQRQQTQDSLTDEERQRYFDLSAQLEGLKIKAHDNQERADSVRTKLDHNDCTAH